jgi:drug/metabolite transporter (DMT)-like permease
VLAIVGGLGAAICWAASSMGSARAARLIGSWATLGWVMLIGTAIAVPATILGGAGAELTPNALTLLAVSGAGNIVGLLLAYTAFRRGKVAVIAPIISTEGAMGAVISILFGEAIGILAAVVLTGIAIGVILASSGATDDAAVVTDEPPPPIAGTDQTRIPLPRLGHPDRTATLIAVGAALCFGVNLYASARIGSTLPLVWSILPARLGGFLFVALPLLVMGRLRLSRQALPFVVLVALAEVVGTVVYAFGARDGIAVAAVTSSQFGAITAVVSVLAFGERLRRVQVGGIALIAVGVALLAALQAA